MKAVHDDTTERSVTAPMTTHAKNYKTATRMELLNRASSLAPFTPLLLPRVTDSTGYGPVIYAIAFFIIFFAQVGSLKLTPASLLSIFSSVAVLLVAMIGSILQGYPIDHRAILFAGTLLLLACMKPNIRLAHSLYGFMVFSVIVAIPMSILGPGDFLTPPSTYPVFGFERITFFFHEPSHYSIALSLAFGIGMTLSKSRVTQIIILIGVIATFSGSGVIALAAVFFLNKNRKSHPFRHLLYGLSLLLGSILLLQLLFRYDPDGIVSTRANQIITGLTTGFDYSSTGVRIASTLAGISFLFDALLNLDISSILLGVGFEGLPSFVAAYYTDFFAKEIDNPMIFNFLSAVVISGGALSLIFYLFALNNIRKINKIDSLRWLLLVAFLSLTHGYLYGPLAFTFIILGGLSISNIRGESTRCLVAKLRISRRRAPALEALQ